MNDADLWEFYVSRGVSKDVATNLVQAKVHTLQPADAWEALVQSRIKPDYATKIVKELHAPKTRAADAFFNHTVDGLTLGFGPKIVAGAKSLIDNHDLSSYDSELASLRAELAQEQKEHPLAAAAGELGGGLLIPGLGEVNAAKNVGVAAKMARGAKTGAKFGALSGLGHSDGTIGEKALATATGAGAGVVVGGTIGGIGGAASRVIRGKPNPDLRRLTPALEAAEVSPRELAASQPDMLADVLPDFTRTVRSVSGKARKTIDVALAKRQEKQIPKFTESLEKGLNVSRGSMRQSINDIVANMQTKAKDLYDKAYAEPDISDDIIDQYRNLPRFREAYNAGNQIEMAKPDGVRLPALPDEGPLPPISVKALDVMKQGMDAVIENGMKGSTVSKKEALVLRHSLRDMLERADELRPSYKLARTTFAGDSNLLSAAEKGLEFMKPETAAADVREALRGFATDGERELFRRGAMEAVLTRIESAQGSAEGKKDIVNQVYSSIGGRAKIRALFDNAAEARKFDRRVARIAEATATDRFVRTGSQTSDKEAGKDQFRSSKHVGKLQALKHPWHAVVDLLSHVGSRALDKNDVKAADDLAPLLVARGEARRKLIEALNRAPKGSAEEARLLRALAGSAAISSSGLLNSFTNK